MAHTESRSRPKRRRQTAASSQIQSSATPQPRPLAPVPTPTSSNAPIINPANRPQIANPIIDPNIDPRLQGVIMDDDEDMQDVQADPAFQADMQTGNGDVDLAAAVSGLLLLGATTGPVTLPSQR